MVFHIGRGKRDSRRKKKGNLGLWFYQNLRRRPTKPNL
jgi:hypothetical protein